MAYQPCSYGLGVVFKENDQVAAYNAIVDPDITGVATNGTIGCANPFPITSGSSCRVPFFTTLPGFETAVAAIAPCSSADWTAEQGGLPYSFDGYYANGDEWNYSRYESVTPGGGSAMPGISPILMGEEQEDESEEQEEQDEPPDMDMNGTGFYTCSCGCPYLIVVNAISVDCGGSAVFITNTPPALKIKCPNTYVDERGDQVLMLRKDVQEGPHTNPVEFRIEAPDDFRIEPPPDQNVITVQTKKENEQDWTTVNNTIKKEDCNPRGVSNGTDPSLRCARGNR